MLLTDKSDSLNGQLKETAEGVGKCPWLVQGIVTFVTTNRHDTRSDATGLSRGRSRSWLVRLRRTGDYRKNPRDKPVAVRF